MMFDTPLPKQPDKKSESKRLLLKAADWLLRNPQSSTAYTPIQDIETTPIATLSAMSTRGTVLDAMIAAVADEREIPHTIGGVMGAFGLTQDHVHQIACYCHGAAVLGHAAAARIQSVVLQRP